VLLSERRFGALEPLSASRILVVAAAREGSRSTLITPNLPPALDVYESTHRMVESIGSSGGGQRKMNLPYKISQTAPRDLYANAYQYER
jgi:hypothetical protein